MGAEVLPLAIGHTGYLHCGPIVILDRRGIPPASVHTSQSIVNSCQPCNFGPARNSISTPPHPTPDSERGSGWAGQPGGSVQAQNAGSDFLSQSSTGYSGMPMAYFSRIMPCHTVKEHDIEFKVLTCPLHSPDINLIEHMWDLLEKN